MAQRPVRKALNKIPRKYRFAISHLLLQTPVVGSGYLDIRPAYRETRARRSTEIVIDGFPRSANTYGLYALQDAVGETCEVRGHTHSACTLLNAADAGVPAIAVVRDPDDAVASLIQMVDGMTPAIAYHAYARFHTTLRRRVGSIYIAPFDEVTGDFGRTMRGMNVKFGTSFPEFEKSPESDKRVFDKIEYANSVRNQGVIREAGVARPSSSRLPAEQILKGLRPIDERARAAARSSYRDIISFAGDKNG